MSESLYHTVISVGRRKSQSWDEERDDQDLKFEVLEYMKNSDNPNLFPTKEDLILGGRFDLVKRIVRHGGWLSYGWELDDYEEEEQEDSRLFQDRNVGIFEVDASSSGRMVEQVCSGIDGILTRLDKERNWSYGYRSKHVYTIVHESDNCNAVDLLDDDAGDMDTHSGYGNGNSGLVERKFSEDLGDDTGGMFIRNGTNSGLDVWSDCSKPDTGRNWSNKRAGCSESDFEAAEFVDHFIQNDQTVASGTNEAGTLRTHRSVVDKIKEYKQIKSHLQNLELELSSVPSLPSPKKCGTVVSDKFWETEIMKARDKLWSLGAQVAVSEAKMALRVIEAQKMVELKQKKVRYAERALSLVRTASVTWHKSATEVLWVRSFDGWTSQRRMRKSSPGIFSLHLKWYPGRYEVKFSVDGEWMIDPCVLSSTPMGI